MILVFIHVKVVLSWQVFWSELQLTKQAVLSDFKKLPFLQVKQYIEFKQVEQFARD